MADGRAARAWVLNLDAEMELERPGYGTPSAAMRERIEALRPRLEGLMSPADVVVDEGSPPGCARGLDGEAWCPTPRALRLLRRAGARAGAAPPFEALRQVNHRRFCAELGPTLPGAVFTLDEGEVRRAVAGPSPTRKWLLKRAFGFAGRGRVLVDAGPLPDEIGRWVTASMRLGGLQVEPLVERLGDFAAHGRLDPGGALTVGAPTLQRCSALGAWEASEPAGSALPDDEHQALLAELRRVAAVLHQAGYFGPFGLDAFAWRNDRGERRFNPRCEINARYSMGWAVGMGLRPRPA